MKIAFLGYVLIATFQIATMLEDFAKILFQNGVLEFKLLTQFDMNNVTSLIISKFLNEAKSYSVLLRNFMLELHQQSVRVIQSIINCQQYETTAVTYLDVKPCRRQYEIKPKYISSKLFGHLCATLEQQNMQKYFSNIHIKVDIRFYINVSFPFFSLRKHFSCRLEFVQVQTTGYSHNTRNYAFCGKRHPWTILHTKHIVQIQTFVRSPSNYSLLYQVFSSNNLNLFHLCHKDHCTGSYPCEQFSQITSKIYKSIDYLYVSNVLMTQKHLRFYIYHVLCVKHSALQIKISLLKKHFSIYDGPTTESRKVKTGTASINLSSFQATVVLTGITSLTHTNKILFQSILLKSKIMTFSLKQRIFLHQTNFNTPVVHKTIWLVQENKRLSYNVTLSYVNYSGPEELRNVVHYGGIAIYLIHKNNISKEVLHVNYEVSRNTTSTRKTIISGLDTAYVVIVYYFYSLYSLVEAELYVSRTGCIGYFLPIKHCFHEDTFYISTFINPIRKHTQCLVVSIYSHGIPLESVHTIQEQCITRLHVFLYNEAKQTILYPKSTLRELNFETYNFAYKLY